MMGTAVKPRLAPALTLVFAVFATACAHVGQEAFEAEIAALRAELDERGAGMNSQTAAQVAALSTRLDRLTDALSDLEGVSDGPQHYTLSCGGGLRLGPQAGASFRPSHLVAA